MTPVIYNIFKYGFKVEVCFMSNRIDINKSMLRGSIKYTDEGEGKAGQVKEGALFGRNITVKFLDEEVKLNRGSLIDYINAANPAKTFSKSLESFGGASDTDLNQALSEIQEKFIDQQVKAVFEAAKNGPIDESKGIAAANACARTRKYPEAFELFKILAAQKGMSRELTEERISEIYSPGSEAYNKALKEITEIDEKFLAKLLEKAKAGSVDVKTVLKEAEARESKPTEEVLNLYLFAAADTTDFAIIERAEQLIQQIYSVKPEILKEKQAELASLTNKALFKLIGTVKQLFARGDVKGGCTEAKKLGPELEKRGDVENAFLIYTALSKETGSFVWRDKAIHLARQITSEDELKKVIKILIDRNEEKFLEICQFAAIAPSLDRLSRAIDLCRERRESIQMLLQSAKGNPEQVKFYADTLEKLDKEIEQFVRAYEDLEERLTGHFR
jgi:hypothetical protein